MAKYRKKPIVIEAEQWFKPGDNPDVRVPNRKEYAIWHLWPRIDSGEGPFGAINTLEGSHMVSPGDWIITGISGEKYPCKPDIFEATYDLAEE